VADGVIEDPAACRLDPAPLLCKGAETDACLTAPQLAALRKLYDGLRDGRGRLVYPGYSPGGEAGQGGWGPWITGAAPEKSLLYAFGTNFFKYMVFGDPAWDFRTFKFDPDFQTAVKKTSAILDATNPDLSRFAARGGKLILYHGWCDAAIPGQAVIDYYQSVQKKMGAAKTAGFVRLFMAPGVQHCGGGDAPNNFGQGSVAKGDPASNISAALERWVEQGAAPESIIATLAKSAANTVVRTRPLCAWPQTAQYKGSGSTDDAANFTCAAPSRRGRAN
jgi:feruloyl esterase